MHDIAEATKSNVLLFFLCLFAWNSVSIPIREDVNVWTDLMTCWEVQLTKRCIVETSTSAHHLRKTRLDLRNFHPLSSISARSGTSCKKNRFFRSLASPFCSVLDHRANNSYQIRLCGISYTGASWYRASSDILNTISNAFSWPGKNKDAKTFVAQ